MTEDSGLLMVTLRSRVRLGWMKGTTRGVQAHRSVCTVALELEWPGDRKLKMQQGNAVTRKEKHQVLNKVTQCYIKQEEC